MIKIKNESAISRMRTAGQHLARIVRDIEPLIVPGVSTAEIDRQIEKEIRACKMVPECIGYGNYRHATCISVNDAVVHGVPSDQLIIADGDCVKVDVVASYNGYCADMARTFLVGSVRPRVKELAQVASRSLDEAIDLIKPGVRLSVISARVQSVVEAAGFGVVRDFVGHGIGRNIHESPQVPNFDTGEQGPILKEGMALAIEPMITEKGYQVRVMEDGWTAKTIDGGIAAHVEDTIVVTRDGAEILTRL